MYICVCAREGGGCLPTADFQLLCSRVNLMRLVESIQRVGDMPRTLYIHRLFRPPICSTSHPLRTNQVAEKLLNTYKLRLLEQ